VSAPDIARVNETDSYSTSIWTIRLRHARWENWKLI